MRIIRTEGSEKKRFSPKEFINKHGKRTLAVAGGVLIIGAAVLLNVFLPKNAAKTNGQAGGQSVSAPEENFFAVSTLNRTKARDEAIEVLHTVIDLGQGEEAAEKALADITRISADMEKEANMETLIKAKGFEECIAVISGDSVNVVVKCENLLPNEIAQIKEIAYTSAQILPENVVITPKN
ncbi:MAG: SpoIIIAH-like family protein [Clostridia bacterium]|nr:SpoIIIAH-like family protein [Clostridia bacterium]